MHLVKLMVVIQKCAIFTDILKFSDSQSD